MSVRKVRSSGNIIGTFPSLKMGQGVRYESTIERDLLYYLEYSSTVESYAAQPLVISYYLNDGKEHRYTPDFLVAYPRGKQTLVECKPSSLIDQPSSVQQIEMGERWALDNGQQFLLITDADLRSGHQLINLKLLWRYRRISVPDWLFEQCVAVINYQPEATTFEHLCSALTEMRAARQLPASHCAPFIYNFLWRQLLHTDLNQLLTGQSILNNHTKEATWLAFVLPLAHATCTMGKHSSSSRC